MLILPVSAESLSETVKHYQNKATELTESISIQKIGDFLLSNIISHSKELSKSFFIALSVIVISSLFTVIKSNFKMKSDTFELITCCVITLIVFSPLTSCFIKVQEHIESICGFMTSLIPTCVMLHSASGNSLSAAFMATGTATVISLLQTIATAFTLPLTKAMISVTAVNTICKNTNLSSLSKTLKSICLWITGLSFTLFTGILSMQSVLQAGADNLTLKGLKFSAAKLIPIAGGLVSESMKAVINSIGFIKSVTGFSGIIFIIYAVIPPLCFILMTKIYFIILSAFAKTAQSDNISCFLEAMSGIIDILLAVLISCSVALIIILTLFINSTVTL